ncbi:glycine rich domain-containing protein [Paenibacillus xylaniclasticus]|uniref:glycine rich domain-containing protein n=1 Tax=Paenibacillus xylaniclasticus TaxID=588083 RepID=UPI000FD8B5C3|nr:MULTISPECIES: glycine rich domain-containing protein [Paenibacillus]GFN31597.1 hypothetical protein PCURB6_18570 [Paenibacillus curdlanolyticus]
MKKFLIIVLSILLLIAGVPIEPKIAHAVENKNDQFLETSGEYKTGAWFDNSDDPEKAGWFYYITTNKKATSGTRYTTVKFIIRFDDPSTTTVNEGITCTGDDKLTSECTPLAGGSSRYVVLDLSEFKNNSQYINDIEECTYARSIGASTDGCNNDIYVTKFALPAAKVVEILKTNPNFNKIKDNTTLYFNPIFKIKIDNVIQPGEYSTLSGIREAKPWSDKSYFRPKYDVPVPYHSAYYPIKVHYLKESDRTSIKAETVIKGPDGKGFKVTDKTIQVDVPESIEDSAKDTWVIACSYIKPSIDNKKINCDGSGDSPYFVRGPEVKKRNPPMYIEGTDVVILYKPAAELDCNCSTQVTIPDKAKLEGVLPKKQSVIGKIVPMKIDFANTDWQQWAKWAKDKTDFTIRVVLYRNDNTAVAPISNTGEPAKWSKIGNAPNLYTTEGTTGVSVSSSSLISYLKGETKLIYNDDLMNYPIPPGGKVSFRYNAKVVVSAKDKKGKLVTKSCTVGETIIATWIAPPEDKETGSFISSPQYWSEIKEGSPQLAGTSSNETFDAMSGTPTTRSLYFASGGSEFIVDVEVEYVPKITKQRTYRSYFTPVVNGWAMSPITGSVGHNSVPSKPNARTKTDDAGATYTENVTLHSFKHVIEPAVPCSGDPCTGGKPEKSETDYYWVQEGYDFHTVGGYEDTWTQTVTFDYMKINKAVVWKLHRSKVNGMAELVGTNEVTATVKQGDPNIFFNQSTNNNSADGRLRYSLETDQHDDVVWYEGPSDNSLANNKQGKVNEQKKFDERRALKTNVTAISDFLILQTSTGDQSVMYFEKKSNTAKTTELLEVPTTDFDTMWTNNPLSAAQWDTRDTIKIGSYNGQYFSPLSKYSGASTGTVTTIFDSMPAGLNRPARPAPYMRLMETGLDIPDRLQNGLVITGNASVFYKVILNKNPKNLPVAYSVGYDTNYQMNGQSFDSAYSPLHSKVNDVVIHNPVSVQNAKINSLPSRLDQRTDASKAIGGNKQEPVFEYERILDPDYRQNIVANGDAEIVNVNGSVAGWDTVVLSGSPSFGSSSGLISGTSFAIGGTGTGSYQKKITVKPNVQYRFEGSIGASGSNGYLRVEVLSADGTVLQSGLGSATAVSGATVTKSHTFTTQANATEVRISIVKSAAGGTVYADNISLKNMTTQEFIAIDGVYVTQEVPNPDYKPATPATAQVFDYTGSVQTFTAPGTGTYTIEAWGAQGGTSSNGGKGGYAKGEVELTEGETIYIYVGGNTGWNGGGSGHGRPTDSGGGASDVRRGGTTLYDRIIVAGGGGGPSGSQAGGSGGGEIGGTGGDNYGTPGTGGTQTSGGAGGSNYGGNGSFGQGGSNTAGSSSGGGGGGGGYYGGGAGGNDYPSYDDNDDSGGGGGSGYIGGVKNGSMQSGVRNGHGQVRITAPPMPAQGSPTVISSTLAGGADTTPPADAYKLVARPLDPTSSSSGSAANFILLDHEFTLDFPNTGDFYGNGQWGWPLTTDIRGKGFVDGMDTTEWTRAKYVKFNFNVIYEGVMYKADSWISLEVPKTRFEFYLPLANREQISALVEFKSIAINATYEDNDLFTNRVRYDTPKPHAARHSTLKSFNIDVVGRIGNMVIEDTGDFRFSNFFKQPLSPTQWLVPNVVKKVDQSKVNQLVGDQIDIRGEIVSSATRYLDTYGLLPHLRRAINPFPLSPEKNNIAALRNQPLRPGYKVYTDLQTIGNYYSNLQVVPYYYHLNLKTGAIQPVDIYMDVNGQYKPINKFGAVTPGWSPSSVYSNPVYLDWDNEYVRRNVSDAELDWTAQVASLFENAGGDRATGKAAQPHDNYRYGNSQLLQLTGRNRTYIGQPNTYGVNRNPGNMLSTYEYAMQAQRWHFHYVLPSSAVAVRKGQAATQANIKELRTNTSVLLMAADIKAIGDTYTLQYSAPINQSVNIAGTSWSLNSIPYPVVAVYSSSKSSADDLTISGTH